MLLVRVGWNFLLTTAKNQKFARISRCSKGDPERLHARFRTSCIVTAAARAFVPLIHRRGQKWQRGFGDLFGTVGLVVHLAVEQRTRDQAVEPDLLRVGSKGSGALASPDVIALKGIEMDWPVSVLAWFGQTPHHPLQRKSSPEQ